MRPALAAAARPCHPSAPTSAAVVCDQRDVGRALPGCDDEVIGAAVLFVGAAQDVVGAFDAVLGGVAALHRAGVVPVEDALPVVAGGQADDADAAAVGIVGGSFGDLGAGIIAEGGGELVGPLIAVLHLRGIGGAAL